LFCNTIHPLLSSLQAHLTLGFLDDVTLGGPVKTVASDVAEIRVGSELGLSLNITKCELIAHNDLLVSDILLESFHRVKIADAILLGAPLFPGSALDKAWDDRCEDLARAADRLREINSQDALILMRSSFSAPKVLHLLRCSHQYPTLLSQDLMPCYEVQSNRSPIPIYPIFSGQASLPVRDGGLGIRRVSSLALPAFVASSASTLSIQEDILAGCVKSDSDFLKSCLSVWSEKFGDIPDVLPPTKQPFWDRPGVLEDKVLVDSSMNSAVRTSSGILSCRFFPAQRRLVVCSSNSIMWINARR